MKKINSVYKPFAYSLKCQEGGSVIKKGLLVLLLTFSFSIIKAQNNLQFNQVLNLTFNASVGLNSNLTAGTITVPPDKVWKIESSSLMFNDQIQGSTLMRVNSQVLFSSYSSNVTSMVHPVWLSAGTYSVIMRQGMTSTVTSMIGAISAIEFNIIP